MNTTMRNRLIGLAIVLVVLFLLSWLVPRHQASENEHSIPVSAIPVGAASTAAAGVAATPVPEGTAGAAKGANNGIVSADGGGIQTQPYQSTGTAAAANGGSAAQASAAETASQYATASARSSRPDAGPAKSEAESETKPETKPMAPTAAGGGSHTPAQAGQAGGTYVQIGSYSEMANAQKVLASLKRGGFHGRMESVSINGKTLYRVRLGPYADEDAAAVVQKRLVAKGFKGSQVVSG